MRIRGEGVCVLNIRGRVNLGGAGWFVLEAVGVRFLTARHEGTLRVVGAVLLAAYSSCLPETSY